MKKNIFLIIIILGVLIAPFVPCSAHAGTQVTVAITASPNPGNITCPWGYTITVITPYEIQMSWNNPPDTTMILRGAYDRWPGNITDGFEVYTGNGTSTTHWVNTEFIGVDIYYKGWSQYGNGTIVPCFISGTVQGGEGVTAIGLFAGLFVCLGIMGTGWLFKSLAIMMGGTIAWVGIGAYAFNTSSSAWDLHYIMGCLCFAMAVVCLFVTAKQRNEREEEKANKLKVEVKPTKSYAERYKEYQARTGSLTQEEKDARDERRFRKRMS